MDGIKNAESKAYHENKDEFHPHESQSETVGPKLRLITYIIGA